MRGGGRGLAFQISSCQNNVRTDSHDLDWTVLPPPLRLDPELRGHLVRPGWHAERRLYKRTKRRRVWTRETSHSRSLKPTCVMSWQLPPPAASFDHLNAVKHPRTPPPLFGNPNTARRSSRPTSRFLLPQPAPHASRVVNLSSPPSAPSRSSSLITLQWPLVLFGGADHLHRIAGAAEHRGRAPF